MIVSIDKAEYLNNYVLKLHFTDGVERNIDFGDFLKKAKNPMTRKYLDKQLFQSFSVNYGDLIWNDYEMCFPTWDLHEGVI